MDNTSDDPVTLAIIGVGAFAAGGGFSGGGGGDLPKRTAEAPKRTAKALEQTGEQARRYRRRAAGQTQKLEPPKLGRAGLLGIGIEDIGTVSV